MVIVALMMSLEAFLLLIKMGTDRCLGLSFKFGSRHASSRNSLFRLFEHLFNLSLEDSERKRGQILIKYQENI